MTILRHIVYWTLLHNSQCKAVQLPSTDNKIADYLSRGQLVKTQGRGAKCRRDQNRDNRRLLQNLDRESARLLVAPLTLSSCAVYEQAENSSTHFYKHIIVPLYGH